MSDIYSLKASVAIKEARNIALLNKNAELVDIHLHKAIIDQDNQILTTMLKDFGVDIKAYKKDLEDALNRLRSSEGLSKLYFSRDYQRLLLIAKDIAKKRYSEKITTSHLFLSLFELEKSTSAYILKNHNLDYDLCYDYLVKKANEIEISEKYSEKMTDVLEKYGIDLTKRAESGLIDPIIGMDPYVDRISQILTRRIKNNPILIGEPGVGKSAVVEALALKIARGEALDYLEGKIIFSLNVSSLLQGTSLRGEFESRIEELMEIVSSFDGKVILFIDEIHTIVNAGNSSGGIDISNIIKPKLSRGEITIIGATTIAEYRSHIEKDGALERRFQKVLVKEPKKEESYEILRGIRPKYEAFHELVIEDEAIIRSVDLSARYIKDRNLPDKAIDLMDEAASMLKNQINNEPSYLDYLKDEILKLESEKIELKEKEDKDKIDKKIKELVEKYEHNQEIYQKELEDRKLLKEVRQDIDNISFSLKKYLNYNKFDEYTKIKKVDLPNLRKKEEELLNKTYKYKKIGYLKKEHIDKVISKITGIPLEELNKDDRKKILDLDKQLGKKVIGQKEAISKISDAIIRSKVRFTNKNKPIGTFLFTGNTGIGKTYLAKVLADYLYEGEESLIRLDMSEYMDKNSTSKLIGAPPGYVGYEEGGQLTEKVRINPYSIILFDEIEKANRLIFNILLQILDEGRLTDNRGITIDFTNTIIILTSNVLIDDKNRDKMIKQLGEIFRPEFINRLDGIIKFNDLSYEDMLKITRLSLEEIEADFKDMGIDIQIEEDVVKKIVDLSNYKLLAAREIRRIINDRIVSLVSRKILEDNLEKDTILTIRLEDGEISLNTFKK